MMLWNTKKTALNTVQKWIITNSWLSWINDSKVLTINCLLSI